MILPTGMGSGRDPETDERHRYEITAAMNVVVRACQDISREHSYRGFWIPTSTNGDPSSNVDALRTAGHEVLGRLQRTIECAQVVIRHVQSERTADPKPGE